MREGKLNTAYGVYCFFRGSQAKRFIKGAVNIICSRDIPSSHSCVEHTHTQLAYYLGDRCNEFVLTMA